MYTIRMSGLSRGSVTDEPFTRWQALRILGVFETNVMTLGYLGGGIRASFQTSNLNQCFGQYRVGYRRSSSGRKKIPKSRQPRRNWKSYSRQRNLIPRSNGVRPHRNGICIKCGRTSENIREEDARAELAYYDCVRPSPRSNVK